MGPHQAIRGRLFRSFHFPYIYKLNEMNEMNKMNSNCVIASFDTTITILYSFRLVRFVHFVQKNTQNSFNLRYRKVG